MPGLTHNDDGSLYAGHGYSKNEECGFTDESIDLNQPLNYDKIIELTKPIEDYIESIWQIDRIKAEQLALLINRVKNYMAL